MNSIQAQIKNISKRIDIGNSSKKNNLKKTFSTKSIISLRTNSKNKKYLLSSNSSLTSEHTPYIKKRKSRPLSVNCRIGSIDSNKSNKRVKIYNEEKQYKKKYNELREKFELQREKMKSEKQNIMSLQQKIKIFDKKFEKYPELIEYNNTLNEQNQTLIDNLSISDEVRKKQSKLIEALQNEIKSFKNSKYRKIQTRNSSNS